MICFVNLLIDCAREDVDEMFETHDKDRDGMLSWAEFSGEETKNEKAFKLMDADHNGKITKNVSLVFWSLEGQSGNQFNPRRTFNIFLGQNKQHSFSL